MEGVGIVSTDGHVLFVRQLNDAATKEKKIPSSQLLALYAAGKFAHEEAACQTLSALSDQKRVNMIVKDNFTIICWFCSSIDECLARRLAEYVFDELMMFLGEEDLGQLDQSSRRDLRLAFQMIDCLLTRSDELPVWLVTEYPLHSINPPSGLADTLDAWAKRIETPYAALIDGNELLVATALFNQQLTHHEINLLILCASNISSCAVVEV